MKTSVKNTKGIWKELLWFTPSRVSNDWVEISHEDKSNAWVDELIRQTRKQRSHQGQVYLICITISKTKC